MNPTINRVGGRQSNLFQRDKLGVEPARWKGFATAVVSAKHAVLAAWFLAIAGCVGTVARAYQVNPNLVKAKGLKVYSSGHLEVFFTGDLQPHVQPLLEEGNRFLQDLASRWSVILPETPIPLSLSTVPFSRATWSHLGGPDWLASRYDPVLKRIDLRILKPSRFRQVELVEALCHELVHYLLNLKRQKPLPMFMEEAVSQYYGRSGQGRDRYLAIWGMYRVDNLESFLTEDKTFREKNDFYYGAVLGRHFLVWILERHPESEKRFVQALLRGRRLDVAYREAGIQNGNALLAGFTVDARERFKLHTMLYTLDFWLILGGLLSLVLMVLKVRRAFLFSRGVFTAIEVAPSAGEVDASLFTGPAFKDPVVREKRPVPELDRLDDEPGKAETGFPVSAHLREIAEFFSKFDSVVEKGRRERDGEIDDDVDGVFRQWAGLPEEPESDPDEEKAWDEDIDNLFQSWENEEKPVSPHTRSGKKTANRKKPE